MMKSNTRYVASADWGYGCRIAFVYKTRQEAVDGIKAEIEKEMPVGETGSWEVHTLDGMVVERGTLKK
jgi:hypothetical protein